MLGSRGDPRKQNLKNVIVELAIHWTDSDKDSVAGGEWVGIQHVNEVLGAQ